MAASGKRDMIRIRVTAETKALLRRAAIASRQTLSDFVMSNARREAQETLFGQPLVSSDEHAFDAFLDMLDNPPPTSPEAKLRLTRKPLWQP